MANVERPLSPHLSTHRLMSNMLQSIAHRITGAALTAGTLLLVYWIGALAAGPDAFQTAQAVIGSILGRLVLFGWSAALFYHLCSGIRHLVWDAGYGYSVEATNLSGMITVSAAVVLTLLAWIIAYMVM